jgi:hypothetical protein
MYALLNKPACQRYHKQRKLYINLTMNLFGCTIRNISMHTISYKNKMWNNYPDFFFIIAQIINVEETNILSRINEQRAKKTHHDVYNR